MPHTYRTNAPLISNRPAMTQKIAAFWNQISLGWRTIWGPHIHHGYYENDRSLTPLEAQENLLHKITEKLAIKPQSSILDVGCGMGGSSLYLAKEFDAIVTGITLSSEQVLIATQQAKAENLRNVTFKIEDALSLASFADNAFDMVWSLESCEQFCDKALFLEQAYRVLKPGGKFMLATWCSSHEVYSGKEAKLYKELCEAFDLPYMPTMQHYRSLLEAQHYLITETLDWTANTEKSWSVGLNLANTYSFFKILKMAGWRGFRFVQQLKLMKKAFAEQRIKYGVFIAIKA